MGEDVRRANGLADLEEWMDLDAEEANWRNTYGDESAQDEDTSKKEEDYDERTRSTAIAIATCEGK